MKKRILSGMRPTGKLHIGHLFGALENWVKLQKDYECFFMIADYHALTIPTNVKKIKEDRINLALDFLAAGIDPKKSTIFIQSEIPEHAELALLLGMITPVSWLLRCPTYKEQIKNYPEYQNFGLLGYPVLQAADILIYKAEVVPVGEDQVPHVELSRAIARAFNNKFGKVFPEPKVLLTKTPKIMGLDRPSEKMSKSFGDQNCLYLSDTPAVLREKIKKAVTDIGPKTAISDKRLAISKMSPGVANLFMLMELCSPKKTLNYFENLYQKGNIKYEKMKEVLGNDLAEFLKPIRDKREKLAKNKKYVEEILEKGKEKARKIAKETIFEVKEKIGL